MVVWDKSTKIDLEEEPQLFTGRVYIPILQLGISQVVRVKTFKNGDLIEDPCFMCNLAIKDCFCFQTL